MRKGVTMNKSVSRWFTSSGIFFGFLFVLAMGTAILFSSNASAGVFSEGKDPAQAAPADDTPLTLGLFRKIASEQSSTVVNIRTTKTFKNTMQRPNTRDPFEDYFGFDFWKRFYGIPEEYKMQSLGSGVIIDEAGYILTNYHVVKDMDDIKVSLHDGKEYDAEVVGTDNYSDLALLKGKDMKNFTVARIGDSDSLYVGDWVTAIGNPFGYGHTMTVGIVSALGRVLQGEDREYSDLIQTDAPINPGNSGGPLFDTKGRLVGITTAIAARVEQSAGIGFAIPINLANDLLPQLKDKGKVVRGWLGVYIQEITQELADSLQLPDTKGALVSKVEEGSPADEAGIQREDVILSFDGKEIENSRSLSRIVAATQEGKKVEVKIIRKGKSETLKVKLGTRPDESEMTGEPAPDKEGEVKNEAIGITVQNISAEYKKMYNLPKSKGVIISEVQPGKPAEEAGLRRGDLVVEMNRTAIDTIDDFKSVTKSLKSGDSVVFYVRRGNANLYLALKL